MGSNNYSMQVQQLVDDLTKWKDYIAYNTSTIQQFTDTVDTLQSQIDNLETMIEALNIKLDAHIENDADYVRISKSFIELGQAKNQYDLASGLGTANIMTANDILKSYTNQNEVYVYANKTVAGLYIDGVEIKSVQDASAVAGTKAFYKFSGSDTGLTHNLLAVNTNNVNGVKLIFTNDNNFNDVSNYKDTSVSKVLNINIKPIYASKKEIVPPSTLIENTTGIKATNLNIYSSSNTKKTTNKTAVKITK